MKTKVRYLTIFSACLVTVFIAYSVFSAGTKTRPVISDGERAAAWVACQNLMSIHNYMHGINHNLEELGAIWVSDKGEYAKTAKFSNPNGVWEGMDLIKVFYGNPSTKDPSQSIQEMIKNEPSQAPVGSMGIHQNTTGCIVVADDGKTAKGIWYSPGPMFSFRGQKDEHGNDIAGGTLYMEKYGVDFAKEDGEWKIWHIQMFYDFVFDLTQDWTRPLAQRQGMAPPPEDKGQGDKEPAVTGMGNLPAPTRPNPYIYEQWSPTRVSVMEPKIPEPYYTFSETFSY